MNSHIINAFMLYRVGWTVDEAGLDLGEVPHSYGYGGTGKSVENNNYQKGLWSW